MAPGASAIVVSYNSRADLAGCIESLLPQPDLHEIIVVDNDSSDGSADAVETRFPRVRVVRSRTNLGFGGAANAGARVATGDVLLVLNPDVRLGPRCVQQLRRHVLATGGVAGPLTDIGDLGERGWGVELDWLGMPKPRERPGRFFYVQGNALAVERGLFDEIAGFDERLFLFVEDVELCWRARLAGAPVDVVDTARARHAGGGTIGGGYVRAQGRTTSDLRFGLRERNTLAVFVACAPGWLLAVFVPLHVVKLLATAAVVRAMGRRALSRELLRGLAWNVGEARASLARRQSAPRAVGRTAVLRGTMRFGLSALAVLRKDGLPRFVDSRPDREPAAA